MDRLFARHFNLMQSVAAKLLGRDTADAADAFQDALCRALENRDLPRLHDAVSAEQWLVTLTSDSARKTRKARQRARHRTADACDAKESQPDQVQLAKEAPDPVMVSEALEVFHELPREDQEVLTLSWMDGMTSAEIAETRGRTEAAVQSQMYRARTRLATLAAKRTGSVGKKT